MRQKFYLKSFEDRRKYGLLVGKQLHTIEGIRKHKYITLEGVEVCGTAWYIIHGIPKSTYHNYIGKYHHNMVSDAQGNKGIKQPRNGTVQAMGTRAAIIHYNADRMPHQMCGIGNGRVDTLKFLLARNNWKSVRVDTNEVLYGTLDFGFVSQLISYRSSSS